MKKVGREKMRGGEGMGRKKSGRREGAGRHMEEKVERIRSEEEVMESRGYPPGCRWSVGGALSPLGEISVGGIYGAPLQCIGPALPWWLRQWHGGNLCISYRQLQYHRKF